MNCNKTPGIDGLSTEFYKVFWNKIKLTLFNAIEYCIQNNKPLYLSGRRGVLALIPKKNRPSEYITNFRPLTLMATDHKIFAKLLATRIKPVLKYLIGKQQSGYMEGRFIGINVRRLMDLLHYVENEQIEALLISVDFSKCFDTIEFDSIRGALKYFNFGEGIINMIFLLYDEFETCVLYNGHKSEFLGGLSLHLNHLLS